MKSWIKDQFLYLLNIIQFRYYRSLADREHKLTGKRYFVIPKNKYSLTIVNNDYVRRYNIAAARLNYKKITSWICSGIVITAPKWELPATGIKNHAGLLMHVSQHFKL